MLKTLRTFIVRRFLVIARSIAFYPTLLAVLFVGLAVVMRSVSSPALLTAVNEVVPWLIIRDGGVSLSILTTLIGGIISLMVFSFSMVMVVLSNATANLTPRLLPRLIENRRNQLVLGLCLGTILYDIIVALDYGPSGNGERGDTPPALAVALAIVLGIACLASFVTFIHSVSSNVQVGQVLRNVHRETVASIEGVLDRKATVGPYAAPPQHDDWDRVDAAVAGFFQGVDASSMRKYARKRDTRIVVTARRGAFLLPGDELARIEPTGRLATGDAQFRALFTFDPDELTHQYFVHGFERITEVALKALSPGINDPGTALTSIDYLKHLFTLALATHGWEVLPEKHGGEPARVWLRVESWSELLERTWTSLYTYGEDDPAILERMQTALEAIGRRVPSTQADRAAVVERVCDPLGPRREELRYAREGQRGNNSRPTPS